MARAKHIGTVTVRDHRVRFVIDLEARGGTWSPALFAFLNGPNGSPAGRGPKGWPQPLADAFRPYYATRGTWSNALTFYLPHLTFRRAFQLRRFGALRVMRAQDRAIRAIVRALPSRDS